MTRVTAPITTTRRSVRVRGVVQGVGFRPFVHHLAEELGLEGHVGNDTDGVFVEVEGFPEAVDEFERRVRDDVPPLARVECVESTVVDASGVTGAGFRIVESRPGSGVTFVSPDVALCDDCRRELFDPDGPSVSLPVHHVHQLRSAVHDHGPASLRPAQHHDGRFRAVRRLRRGVRRPSRPALPRAAARVPGCGPTLWFEHARRTTMGSDAALAAAQEAIRAGAIVAIKGLGGYHLACAATDDGASRGCGPARGARQAVRGHGSRPRRRAAPRSGRSRRGRRARVARPPDRAARAPDRRARFRARRAGEPSSRGHAALHAGAPPALPGGTGTGHRLDRARRARDDERQPHRRADRVRRRGRASTGCGRSPTGGSSTTGRSTCPVTTRSSASSTSRTRSSCRSADRAATRRCR